MFSFIKDIIQKLDSYKKTALEADSLALINEQYQFWLRKNAPDTGPIEAMKKELSQLTYQPKISLIIRVEDEPTKYLEEAIESVKKQIYPNFQLLMSKDGELKEPIQGEFVAFLNQNDLLWPHGLFLMVKLLNQKNNVDLIYGDEDKIDARGSHIEPFFKPDWSPDLLLSVPYIGSFFLLRYSLFQKIGGLRREAGRAWDWDLILRATEVTKNIEHIPTIIYSRRLLTKSMAGWQIPASDELLEDQKRILREALQRREVRGEIEKGPFKGAWRIKYEIVGNPLISIIISTKDRTDMLSRCVNGIFKNDYDNFEILVVNNRSEEARSLEYFKEISKLSKIKVLEYDKPFNIAEIYNFAVNKARGEYIVFMGNDTEPISSDWLRRMLGYGQRPEVGVVGAKLFYSDKTIQHAGVVLGYGQFPDKSDHVAGHCFSHFKDSLGYFGFIQLTRNCSAVTGAVILTKKKLYQAVGGFDGENLRVLFNDVDYCLKLRQKGYYIVYAPECVLYHKERGSLGRVGIDWQMNPNEIKYMRDKWAYLEDNDPFYNPNLSLERTDYSLQI